MPTNRDAIGEAIRQWLISALPGTATEQNIIMADDEGRRPTLPYMTVLVTLADLPSGTDERFQETAVGGEPTIRARGQRLGTVSIQGFGRDTSGWIEVATLRLEYDSIRDALTAEGLTVTTLGGGVTDVSALIDTEIEARYQRDFEIGYAVLDAESEELIPASLFRTDLTLTDGPGDPDPLVVTIDIAI
jgi:hypothetical protein